MIQWLNVVKEKEKEMGVRFLCRNAENLGVPYKWSTVLFSLICSLSDEGFMIGIDGKGQVRGALAYTFGTGEDDYQDRNRIEVHLLYIDEGARSLTGLADTIHAFSQQVLGLLQHISEIGFYCDATDHNRRLYGKFAMRQNTKLHACGMLDFYTVTPESLRQYTENRAFRREQIRE